MAWYSSLIERYGVEYKMKKKWFHTADNTIIDCPSVNYKYNWDTYKKEKNIFWGISALGFIVALCVMVFSDTSVIQTIAGAFMGGILSLFVWLLTIRHQDKINYELANVDMHIMKIDEILELQQSKTKFIKPEDEELVDYDNNDVGLRFLLLLQVLVNLKAEEEIDSSSIELKFLNDEKLSIEQFITKSETLLMTHKFRAVTSDDEWSEIVAWNNWYLDWQLNDLKKKLIRYKMYILCGNVPQSYSEINKVKRKGK